MAEFDLIIPTCSKVIGRERVPCSHENMATGIMEICFLTLVPPRWTSRILGETLRPPDKLLQGFVIPEGVNAYEIPSSSSVWCKVDIQTSKSQLQPHCVKANTLILHAQ